MDAQRHQDGWSPLMAASHKGSLSAVSFLCERGAAFEIRERRFVKILSALDLAGHIDVARLLRERGASTLESRR